METVTETQAEDIHWDQPEDENPDNEEMLLNAPWLHSVEEEDENQWETLKTEQEISIDEEVKDDLDDIWEAF